MRSHPEVHGGITEPKYWSPSPPSHEGGGSHDKCDDKVECMRRFPEAITFHHSLGKWVEWRNETSETSLSTIPLQLNSLSRTFPGELECGREAWWRDFWAHFQG